MCFFCITVSKPRKEIFYIKIVANIQLFHSWISLSQSSRMEQAAKSTNNFHTFLPATNYNDDYLLHSNASKLITIYDFWCASRQTKRPAEKKSWEMIHRMELAILSFLWKFFF